jgi:hypothetical protein
MRARRVNNAKNETRNEIFVKGLVELWKREGELRKKKQVYELFCMVKGLSDYESAPRSC